MEKDRKTRSKVKPVDPKELIETLNKVRDGFLAVELKWRHMYTQPYLTRSSFSEVNQNYPKEDICDWTEKGKISAGFHEKSARPEACWYCQNFDCNQTGSRKCFKSLSTTTATKPATDGNLEPKDIEESTMANTENDATNAQLVNPDPEKIKDSYYFTKVFDLYSTDLECLSRGMAIIDKFGDVHHDKVCLCPDSTLKTTIDCICLYEDVSDPYSSFDCDPLQQLRLAIELQSKEEESAPLQRTSEVFEEPPQFNFATMKKILVEALRIRD